MMHISSFACFALCASLLSTHPFEHVDCDSVSLDGEWEMAYSPYEYHTVACPDFTGVKIPGAVPGYWEDMRGKFLSAGMPDNFRINPWYEKQTLPIRGSASDTTLPDIYGCFFYRRTFTLTDSRRPAFLHFLGVRNQVHAWINGRFVAFRAGFSTPFELPVPEGVLREGRNEIVLAVCNNPNLGYCDHVCGLTTRGLFRSTGGVNGSLELRFLRSDLADVYVTTAADLKNFTVHVSGKDRFEYEITDGGRTLARGEACGDLTLATDGFELWSPESPKLYTLHLAPLAAGHSRPVSCTFGLRRLVADGERLRLNGAPVFLRGVTEHCYFPRTVHLPRDLAYYRMITAKRKELGFNFVRFHTFVPPVEYLEATDELGMLVHIESPNFVPEPEYAAIIAFARRHPSVVIYCTGNETRIDRIAETYLEDVAKMVHEGTDALFSPMSAMRAVEYALSPEMDEIVDAPFQHNAERMRRLAKYGDIWTTYQLGLTSYDSLNSDPPAVLDAWGDAYCGKPRSSHEICIDGSYADLSLEGLYPPNSPIVKTGIFSEIRRQLEAKGLLGRADTYFRNSCEWMRRIRKFTFEKVRAADRMAGFDFLGDINTHWHTFGYSVGMMDEFYRLKPGETVENVLRYNSPAVIVCNLGSDFNFLCGAATNVTFSISNYAAEDHADEHTLNVSLEAEDYVWRQTYRCGELLSGRLTRLATAAVTLPETPEPKKYLLKASIDGLAANEWEIYAFPPPKSNNLKSQIKQSQISCPQTSQTSRSQTSPLICADISRDDLLSAMKRGERVLLLGTGPFNWQTNSFRIGMAGRCAGNFATVIQRNHPVMRGMPNEGYCGWQFRRMMEDSAVVQLEGAVPFDPIIDVASSVKMVIRQAALLEYRVGEGRLCVCSFDLRSEDPAARWFRERLVEYVDSEEFRPALEITVDQLAAVIDAPLVTGAPDLNRARNPQDPSGSVRAESLAQP